MFQRSARLGLRKLNFSTAGNFWRWTTQERPHWNMSSKEALIAFTVFGVTGSSSVFLIRPAIGAITGIEGSLVDGPNSYRVMSVLCISPVYAVVLLSLGTVAGRHVFFSKMAAKILRRFLPPSARPLVRCPATTAKN